MYKQQELEADYIGFFLGARAGFKPNAMLSLLRKLGTGGPTMLDAHPTTRERLQQAQSMLPATQRLYSRNPDR